MRRPFLQRSLVLGAAALTLLTACGSNGSTDGHDTGTTVVATTDPTDTAASAPIDSTAVDSTDPTDTVNTAKASGTGTGTGSAVDPSLDKSIAEIEALLGKNDQDLKDAGAAAANGG